MYDLYGATRSRAFRVMWTLEELGQPYRLIEAGPHSPEILSVNRWGKVPALVVDGQVLTDSVAIMTYLADKHGGLSHPAGTLERAQQDAMTQRLCDEFDSILWMAARHDRVLPEERRVPQVIDALHWEFECNAARLSDDFVGPFLLGDTMTIADILAVHCLGWAHAAGFPKVSDTLREYARVLRSRPAFTAAATRKA